jgi:diacylglycerol kinase (ATP)
MRALLVHNPTAGSGNHPREALLDQLDRAGFATRDFSSKQDAYKAALGDKDTEIVIIAGGDGTVGKIVRRLPDRSVPVAILPLGTANNVARNLGITGESESLIAKLKDAPTKRLDIGCATGPWGERNFLESIGWGALAKVVDVGVSESAAREEKIEKGRELFAEILEKADPSHVSFEVDGHRIEGEFIFVEILNLAMTGPRVTISPSAEPGDGLLDVVFLPAARKQDMIDWLRSSPDDTPIPLTEIKAKTAKLHWRDGPLRIDDDVLDAPDVTEEVQVAIEPEGIQVRVPETDD